MPNKKLTVVYAAWSKKSPPGRGPKPRLTPAQIAQIASRVADAEGLEAVTMQRIAREAGVTTMALYRYFSGKADLLDLMIDSAGSSHPSFGKTARP